MVQRTIKQAEAACDATRLLTEMSQVGKNASEDLAWTVKGSVAVRRKAALTIASAKESVLMVEPYPPKFISSIASIVRSVQKNVKLRAVCIMQHEQRLDECHSGEDFIEFRKGSSNARIAKADKFILDFQKPLMTIISKSSFLIIVDDEETFVAFFDSVDDSRTLGLTMRVPGVPLMQRTLFEKVIEQITTRAR